ncbi:hypothetical protein BCR39DRAFT_505356 [Naematelia encephala]|uniref:SnoaL-like domain-containing protein n=1 Tax=Naematelia encephala TaxID=71784 RepID=A0A1Y2B4K2_9TREE|nr:hypothetical protein BCR39DRAFT_505356 [Naematelia encephala]
MLLSDFENYIRSYNRQDAKTLSSYWTDTVDGGDGAIGPKAILASVTSFWEKYGDAKIDLTDFMYNDTKAGEGELFYAFDSYNWYSKKASDEPGKAKMGDLLKTTYWVRYHMVGGKVASMPTIIAERLVPKSKALRTLHLTRFHPEYTLDSLR